MSELEILEICHSPDDQLVQILTENLVGTPGRSMLYQFSNIEQKISDVPNPVFANLKLRDRLVGTICFSKRDTINCGIKQPSQYIRYFTFRDKFRSSGSAKRKGKQSAIREDVRKLMDGSGLGSKDSLILYAYIDEENIRSRRIVEEFGFKTIGYFHTIPFSRFYPKKYPVVEKLELDEYKEYESLLQEQFGDHLFFFTENMRKRGDIFVIKEKGEIVCGVQAIFDKWKVIDLPGISGKIMINLVPRLPVLNRLFKHDYEFVFFDNVFCKPGFEHKLQEVLETALVYNLAYSGIFCLDPESAVYKSIRKMKLGITHKFMGEKKVSVVAKYGGTLLPENKHIYVSGFDVL